MPSMEEALKKLEESITESFANVCAEMEEFINAVDESIKSATQAIIETSGKFLEMIKEALDIETRPSSPKTPYKYNIKSVIFDRRKIIHRCRNNC